MLGFTLSHIRSSLLRRITKHRVSGSCWTQGAPQQYVCVAAGACAVSQWTVQTAYQIVLQQKTCKQNTETLWIIFIQTTGSSALHSPLPSMVPCSSCVCTAAAGAPWGRAALRAVRGQSENCHQQETAPAQPPPLLNSFCHRLTCQIPLAPLRLARGHY